MKDRANGPWKAEMSNYSASMNLDSDRGDKVDGGDDGDRAGEGDGISWGDGAT